ncbi:hypothetical protein QJS64_16825 [Paraclostridium bifermentans]|uniref:Uncharacterized protein n=1 Tax=Paraclostridium bifermentans TaxID=1490 RepID=A0ABY8R2S9_PARBF|nr:hypothetical protein QJS64_16825 [Paraclostridium bifermentans]
MYNPKRENPILLKAGDYVKFTPITKDEFDTFLNEGVLISGS